MLLLCVRMRGLLCPFQSVHSSRLVPSASQNGLFRLLKAQNLCLLSLQEELHGNGFVRFNLHVGVIRRYAPAFSTTTYSCSMVHTRFVGRPF